MLHKLGDRTVWMIEGNDYTGGRTRYKNFVNGALHTPSSYSSDTTVFSASKLRPRDALYEHFYHDLFHATFRPSSGVEKLVSAYFYNPNNNNNNNNKNTTQTTSIDSNYENESNNDDELREEFSPMSGSWLPVPLQRNQYAVAQYRALYPKEPYVETKNRTLLRETTIHAVECAKSRVSRSRSTLLPRNQNPPTRSSTAASLANEVTAVYVASDTALAVEAVRDLYPNHNHDASLSEEGADPTTNSFHVWTTLDLQSYDTEPTNTTTSSSSSSSSHGTTTGSDTVPLAAEDPPHLNFSERDDVSGFYGIFVDLFLMSYANCVVYGAGGFGKMGSLVSYRPWCGIPYSVHHGVLLQCDPYDYHD